MKLCNAEMVTTIFPVSRLCGEYWCKGQIPKDPCYHNNLITEGAVYGIFYPPNILVAYIGSHFKRSIHFIILVYCNLLHYLWAGIGMYLLTGSLICGVLFMYGGFALRHENFWIQTLSWFPWVMMNPLLIGVMITAGMLPLVILLSPIMIWRWIC
jgi:hypothetical protein